jgi:hypothetical protein
MHRRIIISRVRVSRMDNRIISRMDSTIANRIIIRIKQNRFTSTPI